jgi:glycerate dehydrogenase
MKKIVFLDAYTNNPGDLSFKALEDLGNFTAYERTTVDDLELVAKDAEILIVNKFVINETSLNKMPQVQYIVVAATGYNNIDIEAVKKRSIQVSNAVGYSTHSVAQHVFASLLTILNKPEYYNQEVKKGSWAKTPDFCFYHHSISELYGKNFGILGYGKIGHRVGEIAHAFGMKVLSTTRNVSKEKPSYVDFVDMDVLFNSSDVLSLHCPLTEETKGIIDLQNLKKMKPNLILINTGRGGLINENDLFYALDHQLIRGAALDVLINEPPPFTHPLIQHVSCLVTPHIAWTSVEARTQLLGMIAENIKAFAKGQWINPVY